MKLFFQILIVSLLSQTETFGQCFPSYNKIVVVIGENTEANLVIGSPNAPYMNSLASQGALFTNSHGIGHPSQPNYLYLFSGANQGVTNNNVPPAHFTTPNLARNLINVGKTFISYSEELPSIGSDVASSGGYQRKHNPIANWMGTGANQVSPTLNQRLIDFPSNFNNLPDVSFVIPNQCHAGHDVCPPLNNVVKQYDEFVASLGAYKQWCISNNSLLIVTYDEGNTSLSSNLIYTAFYGAHVKTGIYNQDINHFNILRTVEDLHGTAYAGASATAATIDYVWERDLSLNLKFFIHGLFLSGATSQNSPLYNSGLSASASDIDTVRIDLMYPNAPYTMAASYKGILQSNGTIACLFTNISCGNYYIRVKHKNSLETWSANPVNISNAASYDFTNAASKAFGANQNNVASGVYAFHSGDINQDASINSTDLSSLELSLQNHPTGYAIWDLNGDGMTETADYSLLENAVILNLVISRPQ